MFTGIITATGTIRDVTERDGGRELVIAAPWDDLVLGESIAVDGACLTVASIGTGSFTVHVVVTSLGRTAIGSWTPGRRVNLERALRVGDRLGGHLVQGHVDGVGTVTGVRQQDDAWLIDVAVPPAVAEVSIPLGSITVDGVSLTVNALPAPGAVQLSIVPHTLAQTTLGDRQVGDLVHLEGDTVGKYVRQFTAAWRDAGVA
jgi:riboflavin synthase